jgi:probable rRNA maturation factor
VNVAIVSDQRVRALNREYRGVDHATDVLSFPASADELKRFLPLGHAGSRPSLKRRRTADALHRSGLRRCLGDIVIARGVARRQARAMGHAESTEWRVLALHGLLHLLGYDHERDAGAMRRVEQRLRQKGGLPTGLIERAHR